MPYENIQISIEDHIATLALNRPDERNAMSPQMGDEVRAAVAELNAIDEVRVVVVTGRGKAFSAGGNLDRLQEEAESARQGERVGEGIGGGKSFYSKYLSIRELRVPSIAAVNGHAIGAGFCFALACDLRIVHHSARLGMTFVRLGIHPGMGATWTLPRLIGPSAAADLLLSGRLVGAEEAARLGIANRIAGEDFDEVVASVAQQMATAAPLAVRAVKETLRGTVDRSLDEAIGLEAERQTWTFGSDDALEGIRAIREKRAPDFQGK